MASVGCRRVEAWARMLKDVGRDARKRRTWLWLRARQKDDDESIASLERADPSLRERMSAIDTRLGAIVDRRAREEAYGRELDNLVPGAHPCDCRACAD